MTQEEYDAALAGGIVTYHADFCESTTSLGLFPCNCYAAANHLVKVKAAERTSRAD